MMYMHVKKLAAATLPVLLAALLSACGGASTEEAASSQSSAINKVEVSSAEASSTQSSALQSSSQVAKSSASPEASSLPGSSADAYARASRSSSISVNSSAEAYGRNGANSSNSAPPSNELGDNTPPSTPLLILYQLSTNRLKLTWNESTDNIAISHYEIERDGNLVATVFYPTNLFSDYQLTPYTDYQYTITAIDTSGNRSPKSSAYTIRTLANANTNSSNANSSNSNSNNANSSNANSSNSNSSASASTDGASRNVSSLSNNASRKSATLTWSHPNQRENGKYLELDEIGGYEIRYRKGSDSRFTYITIDSNSVTEYIHDDANDTEFEIAVFDTNGVYSRFVKVER